MVKELADKLHLCFENIDMHGKVVNVPCPSSGIHAFFLKWDTTRVPDGMPLQEYPPTVNAPHKILTSYCLQIDTNKAQNCGINFFLHQ